MMGARVVKSRRVALLAPGGGDLVYDPAIDLAKTDAPSYLESMFDPKHLVFEPGDQPTWWTIRPLTKRQMDEGARIDNPRILREWYIRCGLLRHETWTLEDDSGGVQPGPQPDRKQPDEPSSPEWYEGMRLTSSVSDALFAMIVAVCEARRPFSKPSAPPPGVEPSSSDEGEMAKSATP